MQVALHEPFWLYTAAGVGAGPLCAHSSLERGEKRSYVEWLQLQVYLRGLGM